MLLIDHAFNFTCLENFYELFLFFPPSLPFFSPAFFFKTRSLISTTVDQQSFKCLKSPGTLIYRSRPETRLSCCLEENWHSISWSKSKELLCPLISFQILFPTPCSFGPKTAILFG